MNSKQLNERDIFNIARKIDSPKARQEYLQQVCGDDQDSLKRIVALLGMHENEDSFLESPPQGVAITADTPIIEGAGTVIGPYKLLQKIGEGGMGVVYMAEQTMPVKMRVALKIIKPGMDSKQVIARFETERQALALMDHPNIARVLAAGTTESGRPYFAMELVKGEPITSYCDKHHLTLRERLKLFASVCSAVQHAHQKGIIHRDLKPSNVLIARYDGKPVAKVIDFGVAKAMGQQLTEKTLFTQYGQVVGTLEYMSPEQAEFNQQDIDTRSDIYSLGILLYQLLTGTTPFDPERLRSGAWHEVMKIIREEEPPRPSVRLSSAEGKPSITAENCNTEPGKLLALLRGDLDWLVMKALAKERERRYETASALAADIERYLDGDAIEARPPSTVYRLRKTAARHRVALATTAIVMLALLAGMAATTWQWSEAIAAKEDAIAARDDYQQLASDLQDTLGQLRDELLDRAFSLALAGDVKGTQDALAKAKQAGAPKGLIMTIQGIAHLHGGEVDIAIGILDEAIEDDPDNLAALCAMTWANYFAGRYDQMTLWQQRIALANRSGANDYALLLRAQVTVYGTMDPSILVNDLDAIIERHPRWGVAYAVRAEGKWQIGFLNQSMKKLEDAARDADKARQLLSDNPFVLATGIGIYTSLIQLARHQNLDATRFEERTRGIADDLDQWPSHLEGRQRRLLYYRLMGETERYDSEYRDLLERKMGTPQPELAKLLVREDRSELEQFVAEHTASPSPRVVLAIRHIVDGEERQALEIMKELQEEYTAPDFRQLILEIPLIAGRPDMARAFAKRTLAQLPEHGLPYFWRFEYSSARYAAGDIDKDDFSELAGPFQKENCLAHYCFGLEALSEGDGLEARAHLEIASECAAPGWWLTVFSKAYLSLMDQGLLPVQRSDSEIGEASFSLERQPVL